MARITEVEYEKIFSPKTLALLKNKSGESLRQMLGSKNLMTVLRQSQTVLNDIVAAEDGYRDELEMVAAQMVTDAYPIIDYANIKIDAKIVGLNDLDIPNPPEGEDPASPDFGEDDPEKMKAKRRIINGITQGASIRGAFGFMLFKEYIDDINPELVQKYNEILKLAFGIYDDENAIAMMLAALAQGQKMQGGESEMEYDEENEQFVIKAKAICFPMLVHEIVKGLYEIVGTEGFGRDKEKNQAIVGAVDKLSNEPRDLQYGKFIYDAISKIYNDSNIDDPRVRELFFAELYKTPDAEFFPFIENALNDELKPLQKKWAADTMKDIAKDLGKDDTGLEDLDEVKQPIEEAMTMKQAIAAAAMLLGTAGAPNMAQAQNFQGLKDKFKAGITAVQNKLKPQQKIDTIYVKKDAPLELQKYKNDQSVGYGLGSSSDESMARRIANLNATKDLMQKLGKTQITAGIIPVDEKLYQKPDGTYEAEAVVKINQ
jgi:hypothetical protein